uniref:Peptidase S1 domain-containing protein n=1 Tax=Parascaris univalens TaxID=6257 RepID=A0A915AJ17_PARUN
MRDHRCVLVLFLAIVWSASYTTASVRARRMLCGDDVNPGQYPFFANLIKPLLCGGSLITAETVLTAAHCVYDPVSKQVATYVNITINDYLLMQNERNELLIISSHFDINHDYRRVKSSAHDFALLYLPRPVKICQPHSKFMVTPLLFDLDSFGLAVHKIVRWSNCIMLGFGVTDIGKPSPTLQKMALTDVITVEDNRGVQLLMSRCTQTQKACFGDSGGPILCSYNKKFFQIGVSSEIVKEGPDIPYDAPVLRVCQESNLLLISSLQTNLALLLDMLKRRGLASRLMDDQLKCAEEHVMRFKLW